MNKLDKYESMKDYILESLDETVIKLEELKKEGKDKTPEIYKYKSDLEISSDEISSYGLAASIPWRAYNFSNDSNAQRSLSLIEFRYVNLTKDDILEKFTTINPITKGP